MKKITNGLIILFVLLANTIHADAQDISDENIKKVGFQVRGGLNLSNLIAYHDGETYSEKLKVGFNVGAIADIRLSNVFYLQTGLTFTSKGAKVKDITMDDINGTMEATMNAMYLQVPIYFTYKVQLPNNNNRFNIALGPYFGYGIAGKSTYTPYGSSVGFSLDTFDKDHLWNRPDLGLGLEVQFETEKLVFILGSEAGLTRAWKTQYLSESININNRVSYLTVGFKF